MFLVQELDCSVLKNNSFTNEFLDDIMWFRNLIEYMIILEPIGSLLSSERQALLVALQLTPKILL